MDEQGIQAWRQERLKALAGKFSGKAELGRKLGYRDGAYVGQMLSGARPITEKLILKIEALPGCRGWFSQPESATTKGAVFDAISSEERELLGHWRRLLGSDRRTKLKEIAKLAKQRAAEREELFAEAGLTAIAERAANAARRGADRTTVELNDGPKQRPLLEPLSRRKREDHHG